MRTMINVCVDENIKSPIYTIDYTAAQAVDVVLNVYTNSSNNLDTLLSNKDAIKKAILKAIDEMSYFKDDKDFNLVMVDDYEELMDSLLYISVDTSNRKFDYELGDLDFETFDYDFTQEEKVPIIKNYLSKHPEYKKYSIVVPNIIDDKANLEEIEKEYKDYKGIYIRPKYEEPINIKDANAGINLKSVIDEINGLDLSPLEKVIFVYDLVKEKPYKKEGSSETLLESRSTFRALLGDSIVCLGYSNILSSLFNGLGIPNTIDNLNPTDNSIGGHARNLIYLKDDKYKIDGLFVLDATIDSRSVNDDYGYLYNYLGLLKPVTFFNDMDEENNLKDHTMGYFSDYDLDDFSKIYDNALIPLYEIIDDPIMRDKKLSALNTIRNMNSLILSDKESFNKDIEEIIESVKKNEDFIKDKLNVSIDAYTFLKALTVVRALENRMNKKKYPIDIQRLLASPLYSMFDLDEERHLNFVLPEQRLLDLLYGTDSRADISKMNPLEIDQMVVKNYKAEYSYFVTHILHEDKKSHKVVKSINIYDKKVVKNDAKGTNK